MPSSDHQWPIWFILKRSICCCHIWTCWKLILVFKIELRKRRWQSQSEPFDGGDFGWDVLWRGCNLLGEIRFWFLFVKINFKFFAKSIWFFKLKLLNFFLILRFLLLLQPLGQNSGNLNYFPISNPYNIFLIFIWTKIWF